MSYVLAHEKQLTVIRLLVEGNSISSISRLTRIHRQTICKWLVRIGKACFYFLERELRDIEPHEIEVDEMWTYVRKKVKNWTGLEPDAMRLVSSIFSSRLIAIRNS